MDMKWIKDFFSVGDRKIEDNPPKDPNAKPGPDDPCWCGSRTVYRFCHMESDRAGDKYKSCSCATHS